MKKITTVTYEFEPGDRVIYTGPVEHSGAVGTVHGEDAHDWFVRWDGTDEIDQVAKGDLRRVEER